MGLPQKGMVKVKELLCPYPSFSRYAKIRGFK